MAYRRETPHPCLPHGAGVQVFEDPERAGAASLVLTTDDLDQEVARLHESGVDGGEPESGGGARILPLIDQDGNRIVLFGA
ncbi:hypothetical protein ACTXLV_13605 [Brachybacterium alimentarium]|uniref:hypothetical protein n=1 Tax=Brachybacterium alimentarium TaxID=47845 RepID=UPI003FCF65F1